MKGLTGVVDAAAGGGGIGYLYLESDAGMMRDVGDLTRALAEFIKGYGYTSVRAW